MAQYWGFNPDYCGTLKYEFRVKIKNCVSPEETWTPFELDGFGGKPAVQMMHDRIRTLPN